MAGKADLCPSLHADNARAENNDVLAHETMFLCPRVHVKLPLVINNNKRTDLSYEDHYKAGDKVAVLVLFQSSEGDREPTFPNHATIQPTQCF